MIFIYRDGQQYGPYTPVDVQQFIQTGHVIETDLARTDEMPTWVKVHDLLQTPAASETAISPSATAPPHSLAARVPPAPPHEISIPPAAREPHTGNAITWPFHQENWISSIWIPLLWVFPVFGTFLAWGWSLDALRRRATRNPNMLPPSSDLGTMLKNGFIVSVAGALYFIAVPFVLGFLVQALLVMVNVQKFRAGGAWQWVSNPHQAFVWTMEQGGLEWLLTVILPLSLLIGLPLFLAALVRFGITGKLRSFFNIFGNIFLLIRYMGDFLVFAFFVGVTLMVLGVIPTVITVFGLATVFLALPFVTAYFILSVVPVTVAIWITAYLAGTLSRDICDHGTIKAAAIAA